MWHIFRRGEEDKIWAWMTLKMVDIIKYIIKYIITLKINTEFISFLLS